MPTLSERSRSLQPNAAGAFVKSLVPVLCVIGLALLLHFVAGPLLAKAGADFIAKVVLDIGIGILLAVSLTMVNGFTGQFSIGHAAFMAVGAYTAAAIVYYTSFRLYGNASVHGGLISSMLTDREAKLITGGDLLFVSALIAGGMVAAICGYIVGLPSLRLRGDYLAIVTLGFGEIVRVLIQAQTSETLSEGASITKEHLKAIPAWQGTLTDDDLMTAEAIAQVPAYLWPKYVGGALGFSGLPFYTSLFWVFLFAGLTVLVAYRIKCSSYGRAFLSIREDEIASEAMGVDTTKYKVRAFVISAFFAGIGGGLYAHTVGVQLSPAELGFQKSFDIIIMVVLGGMGSISGAALAAVILTILPELLRDPPSLWPWGWVVAAAIAAFLAILARRRREAAKTGASRLFAAGLEAAPIFCGVGIWICRQYNWPVTFFGDADVNGVKVQRVAELPSTTPCIIAALLAALCLYRMNMRAAAGVLFAAVGWETIRSLALDAGVSLSEYRMVLYALALIVMMILRPQGLFGIHEVWERSTWAWLRRKA